MEYLKIKNWERWQSYRVDRGQPPWIKIHRCVMRNPEWVSLTDSERGQLVAIWLLAADHDGVIPASESLIQKLCFMTDELKINKFIELGFIEGSLTPERRQVDANMTNQSRVEKKREDKYSADFLIFYSAYPLKKSKKAAQARWTKLKPELDICLTAIKNQIAEKSELRAKGKFTPEWKHPDVWLNKGCWEDETNTEPEITYESAEK